MSPKPKVVRSQLPLEPPLFLQETLEVGSDRGAGNLVGIQPVMETQDYRTVTAFEGKLRGYLEKARSFGWLSERSVVVFPEHIGTWLVVLGEPAALFRLRSVQTAMLLLILRHPVAFVRALASVRGRDGVRDAVLRMRAGVTAGAYQRVFSRLARDYGVAIAAGSVVLPLAMVVKGRLQPTTGPLFNTGVVFYADGRIDGQLVFKVFPIEQEKGFICPGRLDDLPLFRTPIGRLGVLICADSWYPQCYAALASRSPEAVVVPSFLLPAGTWSRPWPGYDGAPAPSDVDPGDAGRLTEHEAWRKYALAGRLASCGARAGLNVFLRGRLWDMEGDGCSLAVWDGHVVESAALSGAALVNVWL